MTRPGTTRHRIILAVIVTGITLGILQGLPDAVEAIQTVLTYR